MLPSAALSEAERTALFGDALRGGDPNLLQTLLDMRIGPAGPSAGQLPLTMAVPLGEAVVWAMLRSGADANAADEYGVCPLHLAASRGDLEIMRVLCEGGADVNRVAPLGATPLHYAVAASQLTSARWLLEHGAVPTIDCPGGSALACAEARGQQRIVELMRESGRA